MYAPGLSFEPICIFSKGFIFICCNNLPCISNTLIDDTAFVPSTINVNIEDVGFGNTLTLKSFESIVGVVYFVIGRLLVPVEQLLCVSACDLAAPIAPQAV